MIVAEIIHDAKAMLQFIHGLAVHDGKTSWWESATVCGRDPLGGGGGVRAGDPPPGPAGRSGYNASWKPGVGVASRCDAAAAPIPSSHVCIVQKKRWHGKHDPSR